MYYANGSYYDPEVGLHVDAMPVSSLIENAFKVFGLDLNGLMCDNILAYLPCVYSIFTTLELSPDPDYDPEANKSGWELFWKGVAEWFNGLSNEQKIGWGIVALLAACLVAAATTLATGGTGWAMLAAMARVLIDFAIGAVGTVAFTAAIVILSGGDIAAGLANATADAIFFGGIFSFISAGVSSLRIFRSRRRARRFLIDNGLSKLEAKQVVKSFSGKIEIQITKETKVVYRYLGENSRPVSNYVTPELYSDPVNKLALAYNGNNATKTVQLSLNEGANILSGTVARVGKLTGGGIQYYVVNLEYLSLVKYI